MKLTDNAKKIAAFITPDGLYQYKVMPFGLSNAPATFQRLMHQVTNDLRGVQCYLDDIIVYSSTWEEHLTNLRALFFKLSDAGLTKNLTKSEFGNFKVKYLGHVVGSGEVTPVAAKVEAVLQLPAPRTKKEVMRFLGSVGYYRRYSPNFADVAAPLTDLLNNKKKFVWSSDCQTAYEKIRTLLTQAPVLSTPDFNQPFVLQVDASDRGAGAVLLQESSDKILHPVCYASVKFKKYQQNYSTIEKELFSLLFALDKFNVYLSDSRYPITVFSDHYRLRFLMKMQNKNQRLMRWSLALQPYNLTIKHIKGKDNFIADMLSRV